MIDPLSSSKNMLMLVVMANRREIQRNLILTSGQSIHRDHLLHRVFLYDVHQISIYNVLINRIPFQKALHVDLGRSALLICMNLFADGFRSEGCFWRLPQFNFRFWFQTFHKVRCLKLVALRQLGMFWLHTSCESLSHHTVLLVLLLIASEQCRSLINGRMLLGIEQSCWTSGGLLGPDALACVES